MADLNALEEQQKKLARILTKFVRDSTILR